MSLVGQSCYLPAKNSHWAFSVIYDLVTSRQLKPVDIVNQPFTVIQQDGKKVAVNIHNKTFWFPIRILRWNTEELNHG